MFVWSKFLALFLVDQPWCECDQLPAGVGGLSHFEHMTTQEWWMFFFLQPCQARCWLLPNQEPLQRGKKKELTGQLLSLLLPTAAAARPRRKNLWYIDWEVSVDLLLQVVCFQPPLRKKHRQLLCYLNDTESASVFWLTWFHGPIKTHSCREQSLFHFFWKLKRIHKHFIPAAESSFLHAENKHYSSLKKL